MSDLIWIGNILLPRWFVFGAAGLITLVVVSFVYAVVTYGRAA